MKIHTLRDPQREPTNDTAGRAPTPAHRIAIMCESTACLPAELIERYRIATIPIPFVFGDETFLDGVNITPREFYTKVQTTHTFPQTSPQQLARSADAVVLVTASGKITSFYRSTRLAQDLAVRDLPGARVAVVDSGSAAMGQGFVALAAARAATAGQSLEQVVAAAESVRARVQMIVTLDTLDYLARASRIPQVAAFVGGVLAIKPILLFADGEVSQLARVRTRRRSLEQLVGQMRLRVPDGARVHVAIHHTEAAAEAGELRERIASMFACVELHVTEFTPVMGAYCGPGLLGAAYYVEADTHDGNR
jgi:DegV family protein with EDD domain